MPKLTFYGGIGEIGGNKILLEQEETKAFLDFGKSFNLERDYFDFPLLKPFYIPDLLNIGAIPEISGLYRNSKAKPPIEAVLVTHPHLDHYGYLSFLNKGIDIFLGKGTKEIIEIRNRTYRNYWDTKLDHLSFETFSTGDEKATKEFSFKPIHVDHSVPAAYGFIICAGNKTISYTGDFRFHGPMGKLTEDFLREMEKEEIDVLICEGTNISPEEEDEFLREFEERLQKRGGVKVPKRSSFHCESEAEVKAKMLKVSEELEGLIIVETSAADVDRIRTVGEVAHKIGRELLLDPRQAYLVYELEKSKLVSNLPSPSNSFVLMDRRKLSKRFKSAADSEDKEAEKKGRDYWQQELFEMSKKVYWGPEGREEIRKNADNFLLCTSNATLRLVELRYERPFKCSFILSKSEPFNEEMAISFDRLLHWLGLLGIDEYYQIHISGHASKEEIRDLIERVKPNKLFPVHTDYPWLFKEIYPKDRIIEPIKGKSYEIKKVESFE
jgi:ribonuclease J